MAVHEDVQIIEFQHQYKDQVISLIDSILKELNVVPDNGVRINDEDLTRIAEVYSGKGKFWIAKKGEKVIGTVAIRDLKNDTAKLNRMFVIDEYRGTGLSQQLLSKALNHAKEQNFNEVILNTHHLMSRAHKFYEKNGFQKVAEGVDKYTYKVAL